MNKILITAIGIVVIVGAVFTWKNFYASNEPNEQIPPTQQLPTESITITITTTTQETIPPQVTPTSTPILQPTKPLTPVNGKCGSSLNSCAPGTFREVTDTSTSYLWNCLGSNSGTTASCNIAKPPTTSLNALDRIEAAIKAKLKK